MGKLTKVLKLLLITILIVMVTVLFSLVSGVLMIRNIHGNSMSTTLSNVDKVLALTAFEPLQIKRGDIITFSGKGADKQTMRKRVIGLPNETVEIVDGNIFINGKILQEDYIHIKYTQNVEMYDKMKLGKDEYFVMGDNRLVSMDSRSKEIGAVNRKDIIGVYLFKLVGLSK